MERCKRFCVSAWNRTAFRVPEVKSVTPMLEPISLTGDRRSQC